MTTWRNSQVNYQMLSPYPQDTINLHKNQLWQHSMTMDTIYAVPQYNFGNFTPYVNPGSYDNYLLNPNYTLAQMTWGTPSWNSVNFNNNFTNPWANFGWNGSVQNNNNNNGNNDSTSGMQEKYNKLLSLMKQFVKYEDNGLNDTEKSKINEAIRNTKGNYDEKYERLLKVYKDCDKDAMREFLTEAATLGVNKDIKGNSKNADSFYNRLLGTGFEYQDKTIDDSLRTINRDIEDLADATANGGSAAGIIASIGLGTYDILDVISSWNSKFTEKNADKPNNIIDKIAESYDSMEDNDSKEDVKTSLIKPLIDALIKKAESVMKSLDDNSKDKIEETIKNLEEAYKDTSIDGSVDNSLSEEFNKLYLYTRQGAMAKFAIDANKYYGEIDSELFNTQLLFKEMNNDLKNEGFSQDDINNTKLKLSSKELRGIVKAEETEDAEDETTVEENGNDENIDNSDDRTENNDPSPRTNSQDRNQSISNSGKLVYEALDGWTNEMDKATINSEINKVIKDKDKVLDFLEGYYAVGKNDHEGLIEALYDDGGIDTSKCLSLIKNVLDVAKTLPEVENSTQYKELKQIYDFCYNKNKGSGLSLDSSAKKTWAWWLGWVFGADYDYKEVLDQKLEALYKYIKSTQSA